MEVGRGRGEGGKGKEGEGEVRKRLKLLGAICHKDHAKRIKFYTEFETY